MPKKDDPAVIAAAEAAVDWTNSDYGMSEAAAAGLGIYNFVLKRARKAAKATQAATTAAHPTNHHRDALVELCAALDAVDAEAERASGDKQHSWSSAPVVRSIYARQAARDLLAKGPKINGSTQKNATPGEDIASLAAAAWRICIETVANRPGWYLGMNGHGEPDGTYCSVPPCDDPQAQKYIAESSIRATPVPSGLEQMIAAQTSMAAVPGTRDLAAENDALRATMDRLQAESRTCFGNQDEIDACWDAIGTANRAHLTLSEQVASLLRDLEASSARADILNAQLTLALRTMQSAADALDDYSPLTGNTIETSQSKSIRAKIAAIQEVQKNVQEN